MAFDTAVAPLAVTPPSTERLEFQAPAAPTTILERVAEREALIRPQVSQAEGEHRVTFADILFGTIMTTLTVAAALAGITAAVFLIGMGVAIYVVPVIAAVGLSVTFLCAVLLVFRKEIRLLAKRIAQRAKREDDLFQTA